MRIRRWVICTTLALLTSLFSLAAPQADFPSFEKHVIDDEFRNGYQTAVADIDRDGRPDVIALSTTPARLRWYRNPGWQVFRITAATRGNIDLAPYDIDRDGDTDLALASAFNLGDSTTGGLVHWLECPPDPASGARWTLHAIDAVPTTHRLRWADLDGDGRKELLNLPIIGVGAQAPDYAVGVQFKAYTIPPKPREDPWPAVVLDDTLELAHGLAVIRTEEDDRDSLLTASFGGVHRFRIPPGAEQPEKTRLGIGHEGPRPQQGSSEVDFGHLTAPKRPFIATIEPWHGNEVVVYSPDAAGATPWTREVIDTTFNEGHALCCADLDQDGNDEIIAGHRGPDYSLYLFRYDAAQATWQRIPLDVGGMACSGLAIADLNQDGRPDIVAAGTATNNIVWYENRPRATE